MAWTGVGSGSLNMGVGSGNSLAVDIVSASMILAGSFFQVTSLCVTSAATVGSAGALPATVAGYFTVLIQPQSKTVKIPYCNV